MQSLDTEPRVDETPDALETSDAEHHQTRTELGDTGWRCWAVAGD